MCVCVCVEVCVCCWLTRQTNWGARRKCCQKIPIAMWRAKNGEETHTTGILKGQHSSTERERVCVCVCVFRRKREGGSWCLFRGGGCTGLAQTRRENNITGWGVNTDCGGGAHPPAPPSKTGVRGRWHQDTPNTATGSRGGKTLSWCWRWWWCVGVFVVPLTTLWSGCFWGGVGVFSRFAGILIWKS